MLLQSKFFFSTPKRLVDMHDQHWKQLKRIKILVLVSCFPIPNDCWIGMTRTMRMKMDGLKKKMDYWIDEI